MEYLKTLGPRMHHSHSCKALILFLKVHQFLRKPAYVVYYIVNVCIYVSFLYMYATKVCLHLNIKRCILRIIANLYRNVGGLIFPACSNARQLWILDRQVVLNFIVLLYGQLCFHRTPTLIELLANKSTLLGLALKLLITCESIIYMS